MVRLEFKEGSSSKFWELALDGSSYTARWGRIGTAGQEKVFTFASASKAKEEADKLVAEKKRKGYQEVPSKSAGKKATPLASSPRNEELEKLIAKDPNDPTTYLVYGDWLTSHGDPRGELVAVQHALHEMSVADRNGSEGKEIAKREAQILRKNDRFLPGGSNDLVHVGWRWGFVESVRFNNRVDWMEEAGEVHVVEIAKAFLASPAVAALVSLEIGIMRWEDVAEDVQALLKVFGLSPYAKQIKRLRIGPSEGDDVDTGMYDPGALGGISKYFPDLESLTIRGNDFTLRELKLPMLRELAIQTCGLSRKDLRSIVAASWPKVVRAELWFGSDDYGAECKVKDLAPILDGGVFPKIEHLGLMNAEFSDGIARALVGSKVLTQLKSLDLSLGTLSPEGARAILENSKAFAHLETLNVDDNFLPKKVVADLRKLGKPVVVSKEQKEDDTSDGEVHRYVTVAE